LYFVLDEKLCRLSEGLLNLSDADDAAAWGEQAGSTTAPAMKWDLPEPLPPHAPL
jgi:hypothetical protein